MSAQWEETFGPTPPPTPPPPEPSALPQVIEAPPPSGDGAAPEPVTDAAALPQAGEEEQMALGATDDTPNRDADADGEGDAVPPDDDDLLDDQQ